MTDTTQRPAIVPDELVKAAALAHIDKVRQRHTLRELQIADRMWPIGEQVEYASIAVDDIRFLLDALAARDAEIEGLKAAGGGLANPNMEGE